MIATRGQGQGLEVMSDVQRVGWGAVQLGHGEWSHGTLTPVNRQTRLKTLHSSKFLEGGEYKN